MFDFILSHFEEPIWPRTIYTKTLGIQIPVYSKEEALARFKQANYLDCRINAYPDYTEWQGINRQSPNFIFIDLDRSNFKTEKEFKATYNQTLKNIKEILGGNPTVLFTGNGVHIYLPVKDFLFEQEEIFSKFDNPSKAFLRFAEQRLTNNKSDPSHNPSFKSCLIRIPGSYNTKGVHTNNSVADASAEVKIIQKWDEYRPNINALLYPYYIYLVDQKIKKIDHQKRQNGVRKYLGSNCQSGKSRSIFWIEKLIQTPLQDNRKFAVWSIIAPYLINIKKLSYDEAYYIIKDWLNKCGTARRLDFKQDYLIKYNVNNAKRIGYLPIGLDKLKEENSDLYKIVNNSLKLGLVGYMTAVITHCNF